MNDLLDTMTDATEARTNPLAYLLAEQVALPEDIRDRPLYIAGIGPSYVSLRGRQGGWYRLDLSDPTDLTLRYYSQTKDYWQPTNHLTAADLTLLNAQGDEMDPDALQAVTDSYSPAPDPTPQTGTQAVKDDAGPDPDREVMETRNKGSLAASALEDAGVDTSEANLPDEWEVVTPEDEQEEGLGQLFDAEGSDDSDTFAAQLNSFGLVRLLRGDPVTIDWGENDLIIYPPVDETDATARGESLVD